MLVETAHRSDFRAITLVRPGQIEFGFGSIGAVQRFVQARGLVRPLVIADAFNATRVELLGLGNVEMFGSINAEPDIPNLEAAIAMAERVEPDVIIGFGGGSAMDVAKLVTALWGSGQAVRDVVGVDKLRGRRSALVQVPTTAGTGSEAGIRALVTDPVSSAKLAVESRHMLADIAVIDPELTMSVPAMVTAATGVDAMAHCVEAFTSRKAHPLIDTYALEGARLVGRFLARAVADGGDREARGGLALASLYGGYCLGPVNTTAGHALSYPLGTRHHIAHGLANAVIFPHVLAFNAPVVPAKTALVLEALGLPVSADEEAVRRAAHDYCASFGIEMRLGQLNVPVSDLPTMASEAHAIRRLLDNNPRDISQNEILEVYQRAY